MEMGKKKLAPLFILAILVVTSCEMVWDVGGELVCDIRMPMCIGVCYKSGKCMRCCKGIGFHHGRCSLLHDMGCYCCEDLSPADAAARAAARLLPTLFIMHEA